MQKRQDAEKARYRGKVIKQFFARPERESGCPEPKEDSESDCSVSSAVTVLSHDGGDVPAHAAAATTAASSASGADATDAKHAAAKSLGSATDAGKHGSKPVLPGKRSVATSTDEMYN